MILPDTSSYNTNHGVVSNDAALSKLLFVYDMPVLSFHVNYIFTFLYFALYKTNGKLQTPQFF